MSSWLFQIELPLRDNWRSIELLRTTVLNCLTTLFSSQEYCEVVGMIVAELLENALKYGKWPNPGSTPSAFRLRVSGTDDEVEIMVCNPVDPTLPSLARLFDLVREISAARTPEEAYHQRLRRVAAEPTAVGGLGLARIAFEAGCRLSASLLEGDILEVKALTRPELGSTEQPARQA